MQIGFNLKKKFYVKRILMQIGFNVKRILMQIGFNLKKKF